MKEITKTADILVAAIGRPGFVTADMVKDGATVIVSNSTTKTVTWGNVQTQSVDEELLRVSCIAFQKTLKQHFPLFAL